MSSEALHQIVEQIETDGQSRPLPIEFEMAYQARVAINRIRFAIKHTEQFAPRIDAIRENGLPLLDASERLEAVERKFQLRSRIKRTSQSVTVGARDGNGRTGVVVTPTAIFVHSGGTARDQAKHTPPPWSGCHQIVETFTRCCC
jgi:hypothetical protein